MRKDLFPSERKQYKVNLHCHTVISDGKKTPEEIKEMYMAEGYDAVAFTDHEALILHDDLTDDRFVALNGYEMAIKEDNGRSTATYPMMKVHHLCLIKQHAGDQVQVGFHPDSFTPGNCKSYIPYLQYTGGISEHSFDTAYVEKLIKEAHDADFLVHYNHPRWSLVDAHDLLSIPFDGLEICNTGSRYHGDFDAGTYEEYLRAGGNLSAYVVGGDDNHNDKANDTEDSFGAFTVIVAEGLTYEGLTAALAEGNAYVSAGPKILSAYVEDGALVVHTSPAAHILLHGEGRKLYAVHGEGGYVDKTAFPIKEEKLGKYFRLEVIDSKGNHAYTRAYTTADFAQ